MMSKNALHVVCEIGPQITSVELNKNFTNFAGPLAMASFSACEKIKEHPTEQQPLKINVRHIRNSAAMAPSCRHL